MSSFVKRVLVVGGISVNVYSQAEDHHNPSVPVTVLFFLHGRNESAQDAEWVPMSVLEWVTEKQKNHGQSSHDLLIVTFDQRNHGTRLVVPNANGGWKTNEQHAVDMYSIYTGTSKDVSFLIDFLPSYLYPAGDRTVLQWIVAGKSLGGHATWYTLCNEPRVKIGIPIIACPDYILLMSKRARRRGLPFAPPHFPESLLTLIKQNYPPSSPYHSGENNPFLGKKILALSGADDALVPWSASEEFFEKLYIGGGYKRSIVYPGVGHLCTPEMVQELSRFIWEHALSL